MQIEAIATVCTRELLHELDTFLPTARACYSRVPIHVYTDDRWAAEGQVLGLPVGNVHFHDLDLAEGLARSAAVNRWADHWRPECIWAKLDSLRRCVADHAGVGVLLADCDVAIITADRRHYYADVALSPGYCGDPHRPVRDLDGGRSLSIVERDSWFNAGMLLTRSLEFCEWWLAEYEAGRPGSFYEQTALESTPARFDCAFMDDRHNFGKWRFREPFPGTASIHMHLTERCRRPDATAMAVMARRAVAESLAALREHPEMRN